MNNRMDTEALRALKERLRDDRPWIMCSSDSLLDEAADRIEFLAASEHGLWGRLETCRQDEAKLKARIEQLERELAEARISSDHWEVAHDESNKHEKELIKSNKTLVAAIAKIDDVILDLRSQLAAEKALADRLHFALTNHESADVNAVFAAYRKARGL